MKRFSFLVLWIILAGGLSACKATTTPQPDIPRSPGLVATLTGLPDTTQTIPPPTATPIPTTTPSAIPTQIPVTVTAPSETPTLTVQAQPTLRTGTGVIIDHQSIELFDQIPAEYLQAASEILWLHRHASVGANIRFGLDCLYNYFPDRPDPNRRLSACDTDLDPSEIVYGEIYDSHNWIFEPHSQPSPNPGWYNKVNNFIERIDNLGPNETYQYASFDFGYVEDPTILEHFFTNTDPNDPFPSVFDLENLQTKHSEITFIWWTTVLARQTPAYILEVNQQMRAYALANHKILFDIADIESHTPDGTPCIGIDSNQNPTQLTAVCDEYADEVFAGHLNALGRTRAAKAVWVMMAMLAGWDGKNP
ncbi:MAG TPA: hypothetical protein DEH22_12635 [Chloroflexi bacterium]|nr:hypothetical protein [Chloroflexota bacterium]